MATPSTTTSSSISPRFSTTRMLGPANRLACSRRHRDQPRPFHHRRHRRAGPVLARHSSRIDPLQRSRRLPADQHGQLRNLRPGAMWPARHHRPQRDGGHGPRRVPARHRQDPDSPRRPLQAGAVFQVRVDPHAPARPAGHNLLRQIRNLPDPVLQATRSHHERMDGQGYPDGLGGQDTPFIARVIAVVDVLNALTV